MRNLLTAITLLSLGLSSTALRAADCQPQAGQQIFESKCTACHALRENKVGPHLAGVVGRQAGSVADFGYTADLAGAGLQWNAEQLDQFLSAPAKKFPGTSMAFGGLRKAEDRKAVICFLTANPR